MPREEICRRPAEVRLVISVGAERRYEISWLRSGAVREGGRLEIADIAVKPRLAPGMAIRSFEDQNRLARYLEPLKYGVMIVSMWCLPEFHQGKIR